MKKNGGFIIIAIIVVVAVLALIIFGIMGKEDETIEDSKNMELEQNDTNKDISIDYSDAEKFEKALNEGENVDGKVVKFTVNEYKPDSILGYNAWAGEHLNFISETDLELNHDDEVTCRVISTDKSWGSWVIKYEVIEIIKSERNDNTSEEKKEIEEKEKKEAEEQAQREAEEQARREAEEQAKKEAEENTKKQIATSQKTTSNPQTTATQPSTSSSKSKSNSNNSKGKTVYRTPSGKRYHFDPDCGGKNSYTTTLDAAKASGLTPCKKCAK